MIHFLLPVCRYLEGLVGLPGRSGGRTTVLPPVPASEPKHSLALTACAQSHTQTTHDTLFGVSSTRLAAEGRGGAQRVLCRTLRYRVLNCKNICINYKRSDFTVTYMEQLHSSEIDIFSDSRVCFVIYTSL